MIETKCLIKYDDFVAEVVVDAAMIMSVAAQSWFSQGGDDRFLVPTDLDDSSVVVEAGGFTGVWSQKIIDAYHPKMFILEPVEKFHQILTQKFGGSSKNKIMKFGLGRPGFYTISVSGDGTSMFGGTGPQESIEIKDLDQFLLQTGIESIDLFQINIEGAEYDLLEQFCASQIRKRTKRLQVQFHLIDNSSIEKRNRLRARLRETHIETLNFPFIWEVWQLK